MRLSEHAPFFWVILAELTSAELNRDVCLQSEAGAAHTGRTQKAEYLLLLQDKGRHVVNFALKKIHF